MTTIDAFNLPITNACQQLTDAYNVYVGELVSYGANLRALFEIADANPGCALINAHAAALHLAFEGAEGWTNAAPYLSAMRVALKDANEREKLFCAAVDAWAAKEFHTALSRLDELTVRWPADLCALKWGQYHAFNLGDQAALLRFAQRAQIAHENRPYVHGMIAFALEQNHRLEEAEAEGMRATEIALDDAWAHHAVAHVMETQGRARDGVRWLNKCAHTWDAKGVFIRDHNWWHAALFHITLGNFDDALSVYDQHLWGAWPEFPQEQIGATSMLWRLELRGIDVGERWDPVIHQVRQRTDERLLPFHDVHYLYALARAGTPGEAESMLDSLTRHANAQTGMSRDAWGNALLPTARATLAFARGKYETAISEFDAAAPKLHLIGGSHAQRHLFTEVRNAAMAKLTQSPAGLRTSTH